MRVVISSEGLDFSAPLASWNARVRDAFAQAEAALEQGHWVAGWVSYEGQARLAAYAAPSPYKAPIAERATVSPLFPRIDYPTYEREIARIRASIRDGEVYQVNYTVPFEAHISGDAEALWAHVAASAGAQYAAYVRDEDIELLSWSPELFLAFDAARTVRTKPMKGTAEPGDDDALRTPKNQAEHVMIVDLLRNDLQRACDSVAVRSLCDVERYASFSAMTSTIAARLRDDASLAHVFAAAFPCGSITGAPKRAARAAIARAEARERGAYCGSIGFFRPDGTGWWSVAIRTAAARAGALQYSAGGGIVSDSKPDEEWHELHVKTRVLRHAAPPLEIWETYAGTSSAVVRAAHLERMRATAYDLGIPVDPVSLQGAFQQTFEGLVRVRVRSDGSVYTRTEALQSPRDPFVILANESIRSDAAHLRYKTSYRPAHDRAWHAALACGAFDALLVNDRGVITEGSRTNVFLERDRQLVTPPLTDGLLPGILRARLLEEGRATEASITIDDARNGRLYAGNSARGLIPVRLEVAAAREAIS